MGNQNCPIIYKGACVQKLGLSGKVMIVISVANGFKPRPAIMAYFSVFRLISPGRRNCSWAPSYPQVLHPLLRYLCQCPNPDCQEAGQVTRALNPFLSILTSRPSIGLTVAKSLFQYLFPLWGDPMLFNDSAWCPCEVYRRLTTFSLH